MNYIYYRLEVKWIGSSLVPSALKDYDYYGSSLKRAISALRKVRRKYDVDVDAYLEICYCEGDIFNVVYREQNYEF